MMLALPEVGLEYLRESYTDFGPGYRVRCIAAAGLPGCQQRRSLLIRWRTSPTSVIHGDRRDALFVGV